VLGVALFEDRKPPRASRSRTLAARLFGVYRSYMRTYVHVAFLLCLASACGSRPAVDDYDAACASDEECIIVHDGCAYDCHCGTGALSVVGAEDFDADVEGYCSLQP